MANHFNILSIIGRVIKIYVILMLYIWLALNVTLFTFNRPMVTFVEMIMTQINFFTHLRLF